VLHAVDAARKYRGRLTGTWIDPDQSCGGTTLGVPGGTKSVRKAKFTHLARGTESQKGGSEEENSGYLRRLYTVFHIFDRK
jgi:hypothetical protein